MITISEVIEEVAEECEVMGRAWAIRTLKAKYEGCIVAEREAVAWQYRDDPWYDGNKWHELFSLTKDVCLARWKGIGDEVPLYRAKEPTK
jgi:hypothetical protein